MSEHPSGKQTRRRILFMIADYQERNGYPPTIREICDAIGHTSTSGVATNLKMLADQGYLVRNDYIARGIRVTDAGLRYLVSSYIDQVGE